MTGRNDERRRDNGAGAREGGNDGHGRASGGEARAPTADERGWLSRVADAVLDRVDTAGLSRAVLKEAVGLARHPLAALGAFGRYAAGGLVAAGATGARLAGAKTEGAVPVPAKDRRFADKTWEENALFFGLLQAHLLRERLANELVDAAGLDERSARKARLATQLAIDATAPTNFLGKPNTNI